MDTLQQPVVSLHLGEYEATLVTPRQRFALALGAQRIADDWLRHSPPTALELENAIMAVEDELARARELAGSGARLVSDDARLREIAVFAGVSWPAAQSRVPLSRAAVENAFERLARVAQGRPASSAGLPAGDAGRGVAAALLIVRELMHHLDFAEIGVSARSALPTRA